MPGILTVTLALIGIGMTATGYAYGAAFVLAGLVFQMLHNSGNTSPPVRGYFAIDRALGPQNAAVVAGLLAAALLALVLFAVHRDGLSVTRGLLLAALAGVFLIDFVARRWRKGKQRHAG
ncbi:hypothetical protein [Sphingopyxis sp.]|uniref:hypothetical protein n=1 Tax=Sphingopyxis sp. TaxID=1908224 RepID=UPI003D0A86F9